MKVCNREISKRTVAIILGILIAGSIASVVVSTVILLHKSTVCPNEDEWIRCEAKRSILPMTSGYEYKITCDNSTDVNVPDFTFIRISLTNFSIATTKYTDIAVFGKRTKIEYFWPAWDFTQFGESGRMSYNLFGITNKYGVQWPTSQPRLSWKSEQLMPKSLPSAVKMFNKNNPNDAEIFFFNTQLSLTKSYRACVSKSYYKANKGQLPLIMGTIVSYAMHD